MTINEYGIEAQKDFDAMWKSFEENSGTSQRKASPSRLRSG